MYTPEYRIYGLIYLIPGGGTADILNAENRSFLPMTGVVLYGAGYSHPPDVKDIRATTRFMSVPKSTISWLAGGRPSVPRGTRSLMEQRRLAFLYGSYAIAGNLEVPKGVRLSDYLSSSKPFQPMFSVGLFPLKQDQPISQLEPIETFDFVTINISLAQGILEAPASDATSTRLTLIE